MKLIFDSNISRFANQNNFNFKTGIVCGVSTTENTASFTYSRLAGFFKEVEGKVLEYTVFAFHRENKKGATKRILDMPKTLSEKSSKDQSSNSPFCGFWKKSNYSSRQNRFLPVKAIIFKSNLQQ